MVTWPPTERKRTDHEVTFTYLRAYNDTGTYWQRIVCERNREMCGRFGPKSSASETSCRSARRTLFQTSASTTMPLPARSERSGHRFGSQPGNCRRSCGGSPWLKIC
jgi:hypothetical protein